MKGIVVKYNGQKGYGFIRAEGNDNDIFVHIKNVDNANELLIGQTVTFEITHTPKGPSATSVVAGRKQTSAFVIFMTAAALIAFAALGYLYFNQHTSFIWAYLIAINVTTILVYGYDKVVSGSTKVRVPENVLHLLAFIGGSPGGLIAQKFFRHKTIKGSFQRLYWGIVALQVMLVVVLVLGK